MAYEQGDCSALPVAIVGYSMGGMITLDYAKTYPDSLNLTPTLGSNEGRMIYSS
ncbi:MAG TPA: alpha/beta hydrolase [Methanospirillum sp.]|nr:alpha/beta hydrolase [Methanospirillum sp.]HOL40329.1 alpha/beta hydrolase [Methanospirillum sp.]